MSVVKCSKVFWKLYSYCKHHIYVASTPREVPLTLFLAPFLPLVSLYLQVGVPTDNFR